MDPEFPDPDVKINMSLDEIIRLTKGPWKSYPQRKRVRKSRRREMAKTKTDGSKNHSVPLIGSQGGVDIYVSKKSPLLNVENRRRVIQAVANRVMNSEIIKNSKKIIPAEYKLIKTSNGFERVLVPSVNYLKSTKKHIKPPRKLLKGTNKKSVRDKEPPPLVTEPIFSPPRKPTDETKMDVDTEDDEILLNFQWKQSTEYNCFM